MGSERFPASAHRLPGGPRLRPPKLSVSHLQPLQLLPAALTPILLSTGLALADFFMPSPRSLPPALPPRLPASLSLSPSLSLSRSPCLCNSFAHCEHHCCCSFSTGSDAIHTQSFRSRLVGSERHPQPVEPRPSRRQLGSVSGGSWFLALGILAV